MSPSIIINTTPTIPATETPNPSTDIFFQLDKNKYATPNAKSRNSTICRYGKFMKLWT